MAQSKLELAVGTGKWDAGLKKAQQALNSFTQAQGGLQQALQKDNGDMQKFIQMLGKMDSTAATTKGQMNDYKRVLEQLTADYNKMSDAQKKSIGNDYLQTIDALKQKFKAAKQQVDEFNRSLGNTSEIKLPEGGSGLFGGGKLDGMLQVFGGNLMTKAAGFAADFAAEIAGCVSQGIELARQGEGVRRAFERLGRGDILDGLREATHGTVTDIELMKAAVKFNDFRLPVEELGTMLAFAQQKAKDTGQSVDYMVDSIVTGLGRKSLMILDNLGLSAAEIREKMKQTGDMTKAVGAIIREQMESAGDYVETAADRAAQANVSLQNKMEELGRKYAPLQEASNTFWTSVKISILDIVGGPLADFLEGLTEAGRKMNMLRNMKGGDNGNPSKVDRQLSELRGSNYKEQKYNSQLQKYDHEIKVAEFLKKKYQDAGWAGGAVLGEVSRRFNVKVFSEEDIDNIIDSLRNMRSEYEKGAKEIMKPVETNIKTDKSEQNVKTLTAQLKELEKQRKEAVKKGDQELVETLTKQISQTKTNLGYLDTNAVKSTNPTKNLDDEQKVQQKINDLLKEALTADASRQGEIRQQVAELQKQQEKYKDIKNLAQGILPKDKEAVFTIDGQLSDETKANLRDIENVTIDDKNFTVTADTSDALKALQGIEGVTIDPKTVTITATDEALPKLREIEGITIDDKSLNITANNSDALKALQGIEGVTIDPKTVTITATDEALPKLREIEGITIDDKTMTVTANTQEAMQKVQELIGQVSTTTLQMKVAPPDLDKLFTDMSKENYNTGYAGSAQAKYDSARVDLAVGPMNLDAINTYISSIKGVLKDANLGDELYTSMTEKLKDATTVSTLLQEMMERGLAGADLESTAQALKEKLLSPEGIDQTAIQSFLDELNKQIEEAGGVGLKLNADTGEVTDDKDKSKDDGKDLKKFNEGIGKLSGGLSQVTGGLKAVGVEIPEEVDQVIGVINGVSQIISGVGTIISVFQTSAIVANTVALGALTAAVTANTFAKFIPFFSGGGVVPAFAQGGTIPKFADGGLIGRAALGMMIPGNSMSGDLLRMPVDGGRGMIGVNSGEVILNRAQQGVLANALQDSSMPNMKLEAVVSGEQILLATNNRGRRTGRGEIVQSRRMR